MKESWIHGTRVALAFVWSGGAGAGFFFGRRRTAPPPARPGIREGPCGRGGPAAFSSPSPGPDSGLSFELGAGGLPGAAVGWSGLRIPIRSIEKDRQEIFCPCSIARPPRSFRKRTGFFLISFPLVLLFLFWPFPIYRHIQAIPAIVDQGTGRAIAVILGTPRFHSHFASR